MRFSAALRLVLLASVFCGVPEGGRAANVDDRNPTFTGPGIVAGSPTGGNLGTGTVNAQGVYVNGVAVGGGLAVPNACVIGGTGTALSAVTLGTNLSCTGSTLNAAGGGGGATVTPVTIVATSGSAQTITFPASGNAVFDVTLNADCTFTLAGGTAGQYQTITLIIRQDVTAGHTPTLPAARWPGSITPTPNTLAGGIDVFTLSTPDARTTVFGGY